MTRMMRRGTPRSDLEATFMREGNKKLPKMKKITPLVERAEEGSFQVQRILQALLNCLVFFIVVC